MSSCYNLLICNRIELEHKILKYICKYQLSYLESYTVIIRKIYFSFFFAMIINRLEIYSVFCHSFLYSVKWMEVSQCKCRIHTSDRENKRCALNWSAWRYSEVLEGYR